MLLGTHRHLLLSFLCTTAGAPGFCVPSTYYMSWHRPIFASHDEKNKKIFGCGISHPKKEEEDPWRKGYTVTAEDPAQVY